MKKQKQTLTKIKIGFLILVAIMMTMVIYNVYNNNRIAVVKQNVAIKNLPKEFENFTILQVSDLHEKRFGNNQKRLIKMINSQNYDMMAITGDMQNEESKDDKPLLEMLDGIKNKDNIFYIKGNQGPEFSDKLSSRGCISLDKPVEIKRGTSSIWVYDFFDGKLNNEIKEIDESDIKIAVTHYPFDEEFYKKSAKDAIGEYDLVLAGHYHGGQVRIPFYGAVFIPDVNGNGFLPEQNVVSGLNTYGRYNQYVSRGLGASKNGIFKFRLFNTPEINLITLVKDSD